MTFQPDRFEKTDANFRPDLPSDTPPTDKEEILDETAKIECEKRKASEYMRSILPYLAHGELY